MTIEASVRKATPARASNRKESHDDFPAVFVRRDPALRQRFFVIIHRFEERRRRSVRAGAGGLLGEFDGYLSVQKTPNGPTLVTPDRRHSGHDEHCLCPDEEAERVA